MQQERKEVFFSVSERYSCTGNMLLFAPTRSFAFAAYCFDDERARGLDDTRQQANNAQNSDRDVEFPYRIIPYHIARGCLSFWIITAAAAVHSVHVLYGTSTHVYLEVYMQPLLGPIDNNQSDRKMTSAVSSVINRL